MIILVCSWLRRVGNASQGVSIYFMIMIIYVYDDVIIVGVRMAMTVKIVTKCLLVMRVPPHMPLAQPPIIRTIQRSESSFMSFAKGSY